VASTLYTARMLIPRSTITLSPSSQHPTLSHGGAHHLCCRYSSPQIQSLPLISLSLSCKQSLEYAEDATEQRLTSPTAAVCSSRRAAATLRPASSAAVVRHPASGGSALFGRTGRGGVLSGGATATPPTRTGSRRTLGLQPNQAREALFWRCWLLPGARTAPQEATHGSCSPVLLVAQRGRRASRPAVRDSPRCSSRLLYVGFA